MIGTQRRPSEHSGVGFEKWLPSINEFKPHPLNEKIYGLLEPCDELITSIEQHGVLEPIIVDRNRQILSGHRRWQACKIISRSRSDREHIPATTFDGTDLEAEQVIIEANRQRIKTAEQKAREFTELKRIEGELAKQREKQGRAKLPHPERAGKARDIAAAAVGLSGRTAEKLEAIVDAADNGTERQKQAAREALAEINRKKGRGIDTAYKRVVLPDPIAPTAPIPNAWDVLVRDDRPERAGHVGKLIELFKNSDLRGSLGCTAVGDPVEQTIDRFNLTVHTDGAGLKKIRNVIGSAPAIRFIGLTARQVELIAAACSVEAGREKAS